LQADDGLMLGPALSAHFQVSLTLNPGLAIE
jgi:hypothetical protein